MSYGVGLHCVQPEPYWRIYDTYLPYYWRKEVTVIVLSKTTDRDWVRCPATVRRGLRIGRRGRTIDVTNTTRTSHAIKPSSLIFNVFGVFRAASCEACPKWDSGERCAQRPSFRSVLSWAGQRQVQLGAASFNFSGASELVARGNANHGVFVTRSSRVIVVDVLEVTSCRANACVVRRSKARGLAAWGGRAEPAAGLLGRQNLVADVGTFEAGAADPPTP